MLVFALLSFFSAHGRGAAECRSQTYKDISFQEIQTEFSPYEKVFLMVECKNLEPGEQVLRVNWIHDTAGMVRSDQQDIRIKRRGKEHTAYFWFKLTRRGPIKSALSNRDFYPGHLGKWLAETVLGESVISSSPFVIDEGR